MGQKGCCRVEGRQLSEHVTLGVLTKAVPVAVVDEVLQQTGRRNWRARHLLPRVMVYYVMALTLYAHASYDAVLRELVEGLRWLRWEGAALDLVCKSAITQARVRLGEAPLRELFRRLARPLAEPGAPGAWYQGRRLVSFDGTTIDVPDLPALEQHFGRPAAARGSSGFPQLRLLALLETGSHAIFAAVIAGFSTGEVSLARRIVADLRPGMLCLADRAFVGYTLWRGARAARRGPPLGRPRRRPALARPRHRDLSLSSAPGRRLLPEPSLSLARPSPPRPCRPDGARHRV